MYCAFLSGKLSNHDTSYVEALLTIGFDQPENVRVIGDPQIAADLVLLNIFCTDGNDDLCLAAQFL